MSDIDDPGWRCVMCGERVRDQIEREYMLVEDTRRDQIRRDIALAEQTIVVPEGASDEMRRIRLDVAERIIRVLRAQTIEETEEDGA